MSDNVADVFLSPDNDFPRGNVYQQVVSHHVQTRYVRLYREEETGKVGELESQKDMLDQNPC